MAQCELAYMTWKEVEAARDRGAAVLVPIGTHEQNGTLGPMGTDGLLVFEITKRIAAETGAVVAPLLLGFAAYGKPVLDAIFADSLTQSTIDLMYDIGLLLSVMAIPTALMFVTTAITLATGRSTVLQGVVHLVIFAAYIFLTIVP